jgi:peptidyl-prolyl cis-trans isomerase SDCCAG10
MGSVRLRTNKGDLLIELWSRECPKACRNFVQLCMEGYYDGTIFHRIIPGFVIQGGDPTGSGTGRSSIYGEPFPDEIHSRLRFRYRGILGVANAGRGTNSNGSQFFITLDKQESLTGLHTMFGKVVGDSVYTLSNLIENVELDKSDKPIGVSLPRIIKAEVLENPFPDIVPRVTKGVGAPVASNSKEKLISKRGSALSFKASTDSDQAQIKKSSAPAPVATKPAATIPASTTVPKTAAAPSNLLSEIEKLQMQIKAAAVAKAAVASKPVVAQKRPHEETDPDTQLELKFKTWTKNLHQPSPSNDQNITAESGDWLKSAGALKFAIDSKTAFSKDISDE